MFKNYESSSAYYEDNHLNQTETKLLQGYGGKYLGGFTAGIDSNDRLSTGRGDY